MNRRNGTARAPAAAGPRGATLLVGLIMRVLLTLLAVSAFNVTNVNLRIVGNVQSRQQALEATGVAINQKISTAAFVGAPVGTTYTVAADINQDRTVDYNVTVTPACYALAPIKNAELSSSAEDFKCYTDGTFSLCSNSYWDIEAQATDPVTGAGVTAHQGIATRVTTDSTPPACL